MPSSGSVFTGDGGEDEDVKGVSMDIHNTLVELHAERERLDAAIAAMEGLATDGQRRRGRPPKWLVEARKNKATGGKSPTEADKPRRPPSKRKPK